MVSRNTALFTILRFCRLLLAAAGCLLLPFAGRAETDFKIRGDLYFSFGALEALPIGAEVKNDRFRAMQRLRLFMNAYTGESLRAFCFVRIAPADWGRIRHPDGRDTGTALDADGVNLSVRQLLLAYRQPGGRLGVTMGIIPLVLPAGAFHDGILHTSGAGIRVDYALTDEFTPQFFWGRPYNGSSAETGPGRISDTPHDAMDLFGLILPFRHAETSTEITPWTLYSRIGRNSSFWELKVPANGKKKWRTNSDGTGWWAGITFKTGRFDPITVKANIAYGSIRTGDRDNDFNTRGWQGALSLDYTLAACTPGLFGWYAAGSDEDAVRKDRTWGYTPTISAADYGFEPTTFGFYSPEGLSSGSAIAFSMGGTRGVGARVTDISFLPDLGHEIIVAWYGGTNDDGLARDYAAHRPNILDKSILTASDRAIEVNFNSQYKVNDNLSFYVQLGMIDLKRGGDAWKQWHSNRRTWQGLATVIFKF
jgi:hypothetical protein